MGAPRLVGAWTVCAGAFVLLYSFWSWHRVAGMAERTFIGFSTPPKPTRFDFIDCWYLSHCNPPAEVSMSSVQFQFGNEPAFFYVGLFLVLIGIGLRALFKKSLPIR